MNFWCFCDTAAQQVARSLSFVVSLQRRLPCGFSGPLTKLRCINNVPVFRLSLVVVSVTRIDFNEPLRQVEDKHPVLHQVDVSLLLLSEKLVSLGHSLEPHAQVVVFTSLEVSSCFVVQLDPHALEQELLEQHLDSFI